MCKPVRTVRIYSGQAEGRTQNHIIFICRKTGKCALGRRRIFAALSGYSDGRKKLLKPVQAAELEQAITTDLRLYHRPSTVTFHAGGKTLVIPTEDIYYAESREHGTVLHMTHGEKFLPLSLSQTEGILPGSLFCRCHNSFLVNLSHICEEGGRTLYLTDGSDLTIGRRYMEHFQNQFVRYLNQN